MAKIAELMMFSFNKYCNKINAFLNKRKKYKFRL